MLYLKLAWRNIWRNKRRTFITMLSIIIAVLLSSVMRSMNEGTYENMIKNTVGTFTGYIQIHQEGYWDDKTLEYTFVADDSLFREIESEETITKAVPRIDSYALAAGEEQSRPAMIMGIDVQAEKWLSDPESHIQLGTYFGSNEEKSVLLGNEMMKRLNIQVGDSLVLIGQGFRGQSAAGLYEIKGTVSFPNPELNKSLVLMPLETAQYFLAAPDRLTAIALILDQTDHIDQAIQSLSRKFSDREFEIMGWQEMMPELVQAIQSDRASGIIIIMILYVVVGFGILGTVLMMITERTYEFGVMISVGTPRWAIASILAIEVFIMAMVGSGIGLLCSIPIAWYFHVNPIRNLGEEMSDVIEAYGIEPMLQFSVDPSVFYSQAITIFVITLIFCIIPLVKASKLDPVKAMRS